VSRVLDEAQGEELLEGLRELVVEGGGRVGDGEVHGLIWGQLRVWGLLVDQLVDSDSIGPDVNLLVIRQLLDHFRGYPVRGARERGGRLLVLGEQAGHPKVGQLGVTTG